MPQDSVGPLPQYDIQSSDDLSTLGVAPVQEGDAFSAASPSDLAGLVNAPCRALDVEYKSWRNLRHLEDRAELARDIAALANHGGGYIVFGFREDTLAPEDNHPFWTNCTAEQVATIVRAFLDPPVQCEVVTEQSLIGNQHPIIRVASHGIAPVCARLDGPVVGKARLVERGAYYIRKHGAAMQGKYFGVLLPKSDRIDMPQEWASLIRRCVRQDRETLLAMIEAAIEGRKQVPGINRQLDAWHAAAHDAFLRLVPLSPVAEQLRTRHYALSYCFELVGQEMLEPAQLPELLRRAVFEVQPMFRGVLNMFDPPYRRAVQARFTVDPAAGTDETDFLEVGWLRDRPPGETADFWRLSPHGFGTIVRDYSEDRSAQASEFGTRPGTRFSPNVLAQEIGELVCHTRALAKHFSGVRRVLYRCEWWGLGGRELFDPDNTWAFRGPAVEDHRLVKIQVPAASLAQGWPETVAQIMAPVLRCFEPDLALDADWVRAQAAKWVKS